MSLTENRRRCGAETVAGGQCDNYADSCPHHGSSRPAPDQPTILQDVHVAVPEVQTQRFSVLSRPFVRATVHPRLGDHPSKLTRLAAQCAQQLRLCESHVIRDYWLVRALYESDIMLSGSAELPAGLPRHPPLGRLILCGGTSLSAAWDLTRRFSEDLDFVLLPSPSCSGRRFKFATKRFAIELSKRLGGGLRTISRGARHSFFEIELHDDCHLSVDIVNRGADNAPIMYQRQPVVSLLSRTAPRDVIDQFPETGAGDGFGVEVLGPCSTAMDKLLALTALSTAGDLAQITQRSRDLYDLACIATATERFEGHIGRDSRRLLAVSQHWRRDVDGAERPEAGFAALDLFDSTSAQYAALRNGYEQAMNSLVWGEQLTFNDAIQLALSLDPGPPRHAAANTHLHQRRLISYYSTLSITI